MILIVVIAVAAILAYAGYKRNLAAKQSVGPTNMELSTIKKSMRMFFHISGIVVFLGSLASMGMSMYLASGESGLGFSDLMGGLELLSMSLIILLIAWFFGRFYIGPAGIAEQSLTLQSMGGNEKGLVPWEKVQRLDWDKDVGQRSWGLSLHYTGQNGTPHKVRFYFSRERKEELARQLENYYHTDQPDASDSKGSPDG